MMVEQQTMIENSELECLINRSCMQKGIYLNRIIVLYELEVKQFNNILI